MGKEYKTITEIAGPLIFVEKTEAVGYNELVEVTIGEPLPGERLARMDDRPNARSSPAPSSPSAA
jgi:vacuolar-type H+-ATPase subunit B/Vma2